MTSKGSKGSGTSRTVEVTSLAWEDINRALIRAETERPGGGERLLGEILRSARQAGEHPESGQRFTAPGRLGRTYRCLSLPPWRIFCRVSPERVLLMRCLRNARG